ncbi:MAG: hypothetical protein JO060_03705 [Candidatus Eremiobacteraeota bacterium]|nr:hypothetical protein [Candidatus Eremiobacteraeota bacterium]MBV9647338.1 hypothetical protein [Candidatus Eremiobacteraeota bacterium]
MKLRTALTAAALAGSLVTSLATAAFAVTINQGTQVNCTLQNQVDSKMKDGDTFTCTTNGLRDANDNDVHGTIYGHISEVVAANYAKKAHVKMNFDRIRFSDGSSAPIDASLVSVDKRNQTNGLRAATTIVGAMIAGNILGKAIGTNIGGLLGTGAGVLLASNTGSDIVVPQYANVKLSLNRTLNTRRQSY